MQSAILRKQVGLSGLAKASDLPIEITLEQLSQDDHALRIRVSVSGYQRLDTKLPSSTTFAANQMFHLGLTSAVKAGTGTTTTFS